MLVRKFPVVILLLVSLFLSVLLSACSGNDPQIVSSLPINQENIARGKELTRGLGACGFCHGETQSPNSLLIGGREFFDTYGAVKAANLTPSKTGIGSWRDYDLMHAIRAAITPEGAWLSRDLHAGFEWLSDNDTFAIISYLRSLPPIDQTVARRQLSFLDRNTTGFLDSRYVVKGYVPDVDPKASVQYGQYLADHVARCGACHNTPPSFFEPEQYYTGGRTIFNEYGEKVVPAINQSLVYGIGEWSEEEIVTYLQTGQGPDGHSSDAHFCPWEYYKNASEADLKAIAVFLKTVAG